MRAINLETVVKVTQGELLSEKLRDFSGLGTDTRQSLQGQLFVALKGETFDAHKFLNKAVAQGAAALLIHEDNELVQKLKNEVSIIKVPDTLRALQQLGHWARHQSQAQVIGITGSNGKTTTKEFAAALIGSVKKVHYNKGSFNNHWGVPFTLLQLPAEAEVALVEMGMNHSGELTELVQIAEPDIVICTMVGRAHMEFFGTLERVAEAKEEIYEASAEKTLRIYNLDNPQTAKMYQRALKKFPAERLLTFSREKVDADVYLTLTSMTLNELFVSGRIRGQQGQARIAVFGVQNLVNLMAAASLGLAVGLTPEQVWQGLERCRTNWGRNQHVNLRSGAELIFDAYNANPDSMKALLDNVRMMQTKGKKIAVLGEMLEMGKDSAKLHEELGERAAQVGFHKIYFIGSDAPAFKKGLLQSGYQGTMDIREEFTEEAAQDLARQLQSGDIAVIKGSRGMKLERFVEPCQPLNFTAKS